MDESISETSADAPLVPERAVQAPATDPPTLRQPVTPAHLADDSGDGGDQRRHRRWLAPLLLLPVVAVVALVVAWTVDTSSGGVARNITLAGSDVGNLSESELASRVAALAEEFAATPIEVTSDGTTYTTTAAELGLIVDTDRSAASALEVDDATMLPLRPFTWIASFAAEREADLTFQVSREQVAATIVALQGDDRTPPTEPGVELVEGEFHVVPGEDGRGIDPAALAEALPAAAASWSVGAAEPIRVEVERGPLPPLGTEDAAEEAAADAEALVDEPLDVHTSGGVRTIEPDELRTWVTLVSEPDGSVRVDLDGMRVAAGLRERFADVEGHPIDASFTLDGGVPVIRPDQPGLVCCAPGAAETIIDALRAGILVVPLDLVEGPAGFTVADAEAFQITQPVGGNHAWRSGAPTTAAPGFTTYHAAGGARVVNIHRMADLVRGAVVAPGGTFSINGHVGQRTAAKGFVAAGAIRDRMHVEEIGGGVSQFATTMFNAAYFAGLEIVTYQAHSEYFDRYPRGREATMGYPAPDLAFRNDTPYGILIWTSYTDSSLTVTLYSTPHATAEQTGISESRSGNCRVVTTTRTRTFPDGHTDQQRFSATYRPGEGERC